ncbi:MAG: DUF4412 domain-containing protein [Ignavibacteria bacterium]|nr:DUF4412 domain-containing protein [Ignavibacteria bacterium]MBI3766341.1 DUF4412 domain-containing protein [Ignavibacteriales bacterium]
MNKIPSLLILLMCSCVAIVRAQFEGVIEMKVTENDNSKPVESIYTLTVKDDMLATELKGDAQDGQHGKFIFRGDKKVFWIINDDEKNFLEISVKEDGKSSKQKTDSGKRKGRSARKLVKTGKTETILGHVCDELMVEDGSRVSHIWGTPKLGNVYEGLMKTFGQMAEQTEGDESEDWEEELAAMKMFPLKIVTTQDSRVRETQEVTRIDSKTIAASTFEPPQGYKKQSLEFDMQKMLKGMDDEMKQAREHSLQNKGKGRDIENMMKEMDRSIKKRGDADSTKDDEDKDDDDDN